MDMFKNVFKRGGQTSSSQQQQSTNGGARGQTNGVVSGSGSKTEQQKDAEGFLCPSCMKSFSTPDQLQNHFTSVHAEPLTQVPADKELELLKMQLVASEESRSLLSTELINMQKQMQELAMNKPEQAPDQSAEVKRLDTQIQLMQIENTELQEKIQLSEKGSSALHGQISEATQQNKALTVSVNTEKEKYSLISEQLTQEKLRNNSLQEEIKKSSELLRKSDVALEQQRLNAGRADEMVAKFAGKEELCRNLEQQINDLKHNSVKYESEVTQLKKSLDTKEEAITRSAAMHNEMKTAMESKILSMEALIQEKTTSLDRILADNEQLQHKTQTLEARLADNQTELTEANKKYDDLHQNFVQRIDAGEGTNVIVTQLKEDNARIQEKLKHTEERLSTEKEEGYQKLKSSENLRKDLEQKLTSMTEKNNSLNTTKIKLEDTVLNQESENELQRSSLKAEHAFALGELQATASTHAEMIQKREENIASRQAEVLRLTSQLQTTSEQVASLERQVSEFESKVSRLESESSTLVQQNGARLEEIAALAASNKTLDRDLVDKNAELASISSQLDTFRGKLIHTTSENDRLQASLQTQTEESEQGVSSLQDRIANLELDVKSSEDLLQEKLSALNQLQDDSAHLNEEILALRDKLTNVESEKRKAEAGNVSLQSMITNLEVEKAELYCQNDQLQGVSNDSSSQLRVISSELEQSKLLVLERDASILVLQQQLQTQVREGESLQSSLLEKIDQMQSSAQQSEKAKQAEITKLNDTIEEMKLKIKKQSDTNSALSKEHSTVIENLNVAEAQLASLQTELDKSRLEVESLTQQMDKRADDHGHVLQETTEILQRTSDENEVLSRALAEKKTELSVIEEQLQNAQRNSDDWQSKHRLLQDDIEAAKQALSQEKATSEETKQLLISHKLEMQNKHEILEEEKLKLEKELEIATKAKDAAQEKAEDNLRTLEAALAAEKSKMEESEAKFNMQLVSLTENLSLNKTDLTATQEKLMDVVKHNDELRGFNIELETKLEASNDERNMLWNRCMASETETKALRDEKEQLRLQIENLNSALHELGRENQSLQIKTTKAQSRRWVNDENVLDCTHCTKSFSVVVRKHHCRNCGNIFCHECSSKQFMLPVSSKPSRVCDSCYSELNR